MITEEQIEKALRILKDCIPAKRILRQLFHDDKPTEIVFRGRDGLTFAVVADGLIEMILLFAETVEQRDQALSRAEQAEAERDGWKAASEAISSEKEERLRDICIQIGEAREAARCLDMGSVQEILEGILEDGSDEHYPN